MSEDNKKEIGIEPFNENVSPLDEDYDDPCPVSFAPKPFDKRTVNYGNRFNPTDALHADHINSIVEGMIELGNADNVSFDPVPTRNSIIVGGVRRYFGMHSENVQDAIEEIFSVAARTAKVVQHYHPYSLLTAFTAAVAQSNIHLGTTSFRQAISGEGVVEMHVVCVTEEGTPVIFNKKLHTTSIKELMCNQKGRFDPVGVDPKDRTNGGVEFNVIRSGVELTPLGGNSIVGVFIL